MKILYIGHYRENSGWAEAAKNCILAMDKSGLDVVCRNVTLTKDKQINGRLLELEQKSSDGCDICIQNVLPHHMVYSTQFKKNIGYMALESTSIKHLSWFNYLEQMDELWVPNSDSKHFLEDDGIKNSVRVVPYAFDTNKYKKQYRNISIPEAEGKFKFYYIGDMNDRKNLDSIISCFHSEFDKSESVSLVLKVKKFGKSPEEVRRLLDLKLTKIKEDLRVYNHAEEYIKDITITDDVSEEDIYSLHQYCDCFICPSHGEAWSIPSFEAMAFGNSPICSNFGGTKEFINKMDSNTGMLINGVFSSCKCSDAAFRDIFTGREYWFQPCEKEIRQAMRAYYESWIDNQIKTSHEKRSSGMLQAEKFSYENVGQIIKDTLNV
jgi:glycosyltransferase involved in cell wall biosynthesis